MIYVGLLESWAWIRPRMTLSSQVLFRPLLISSLFAECPPSPDSVRGLPSSSLPGLSCSSSTLSTSLPSSSTYSTYNAASLTPANHHHSQGNVQKIFDTGSDKKIFDSDLSVGTCVDIVPTSYFLHPGSEHVITSSWEIFEWLTSQLSL